MNRQRYCVLGAPRSGSQYATGLISATLGNCLNLGEPFTNDQISFPAHHMVRNMPGSDILTSALLVPDPPNPILTKMLSSIEDRVNYVLYELALMKDPYSTQDLVIKLFPFDYLDDSYDRIISVLDECGFKFIFLKRKNIERQILSACLSLTSDKWGYTIKDQTTPIEIPIYIIKQIPSWFKHLKDVYSKASQIPGIETIYYETVEADLQRVLGRPLVLPNKLPSREDSDEIGQFITNIDEIKQTIKNCIATEVVNRKITEEIFKTNE
jgi:LPS sulfotransferase NodH